MPTSTLTIAAGTGVLAGIGLAFLDPAAASIVGYVLGTLVPFTLVALSRRLDAQRRVEGILPANWTVVGRRVILVAGFVVAVLHSYAIALDIARQAAL